MSRKKKKPFRLHDEPEKTARLDVRITEQLRNDLEIFCHDNDMLLTEAVTEALTKLLKSNTGSK